LIKQNKYDKIKKQQENSAKNYIPGEAGIDKT